MKKLLIPLLFFTAILVPACHQFSPSYKITGHVTGFNDSTMIVLKDLSNQTTLDTSYIVADQFKFTGHVSTPQRLFLMTKSSSRDSMKYLSLWVENSDIKISGNFTTFRYAKVEGSKAQDAANVLRSWTKDLDMERDSLTQLFFTLPKSAQDSLSKKIWGRIKEIDSQSKKHYRKFVHQYLNSYPGLEMLTMLKNELGKDSVKILFHKIDPRFHTTEDYLILKTFVEAKVAKEGDDFIDFQVKTIDNQDFQLSQLKGKYILLDFWSAGCGPCRKMNKTLAQEYDQLKDQVELVSFSVDANRNFWEMASQKDGIQWTNVSDLKGNRGTTYIQYGITGIPCSFLIDPKGKIIKKTLGYSEEHLEELKKIISQSDEQEN